MIKIECEICSAVVDKKLSNTNRQGRPWKHNFCGIKCYNRWKAVQHAALKKKEWEFKRLIWGTTELKRREANKCRGVGRKAEIVAIQKILPSLGFSEIDDWSNCSSQFVVDFVATYEGRRVLVDATVKLKAHIPKKSKLATSLGMRLFIIHVSPKDDSLFWLHEIKPGIVTSIVPATFVRDEGTKRFESNPISLVC